MEYFVDKNFPLESQRDFNKDAFIDRKFSRELR